MKSASSIALLVLIFGAATIFAAEAAPVRTIANFDLAQVRLLPGPFRDAQDRDLRYLLSLDPDRLLVMFRSTAAFYEHPAYLAPYGGWESPISELRGHTLGHYLSACALMYSATGDPRLRQRTDYLVAELAKCQDNLARTGSNPGYLSAFPESYFDLVEAGKPVWAPWYTLHKLMAGLLEVHAHTGNPQALAVLNRMAAWVKFRVGRLTRTQMQAMLRTESGGMNEVLANLSAATGDPADLQLAQAFDREGLFAPLARGEDRLDGLHANTQIPQVVGAARQYELTGRTEYRDIARFFWREVALRRSYVIGGDSDNEHFFPPGDFGAHLGAATAETCNTYNMLKLTEHIFAWEPSAAVMDFYERGLYNQILASQDPESGMVTYYVPMKPGLFKTYSTPEESFWCCVGTGMENHAKYGEEIYAHDGSSLYVNLFIASELAWPDRQMRLRQETKFPDEPGSRLRFTLARPTHLALKLRQPGWCRQAIALSVDGRPVEARADSSGYVTLERDWRDGDTLDIGLSPTLRTEALPGEAGTVAFLFGPVVLAGRLGTAGMPAGGPFARADVKPFARWPAPPVPVLPGDVPSILGATRPIPGDPLAFRTPVGGAGRDVTLVPFYRLHRERYAIYWTITGKAGDGLPAAGARD